MKSKQAIILHSGGMDSSICLALAASQWGRDNVLSLSFAYQQRHSQELKQAEKICHAWNIDHEVVDLSLLSQMTSNALVHHRIPIEKHENEPPNTLVIGRNGLMIHLAGIRAHFYKARLLYLGVLELEEANSGYRDCSRHYIDLHERILRIDLGDPEFSICTPVIKMNKKETLLVADQLGILSYLLEETITCYEGIRHQGCQVCPACLLRNEGIREFIKEKPDFYLPYEMHLTPLV